MQPIIDGLMEVLYNCDQKLQWMLLPSAIQWEDRDLQYGEWHVKR